MSLQRRLPDPLPAQDILKVLKAVKRGDFTARLPVQGSRVQRELAMTLNAIVDMNAAMTQELERVSRVVGKDGQLAERASLSGAKGSWRSAIEAVNSLVGDVVHPVNEVARVIGAVAKGNLSQTMPLEIDGRRVKGAFFEMAQTVNTVVDQLNAFASEVTRVAREVGTEGKLGGQADVKGVAGVWKDLTDNVNSMASNLTNQVRNIADVTTAVAKGDLSKKITVEVRGEILRAQEHHQHHGGPVELLRLGSDARGARSGDGREAGRSGRGEGIAGVWKDLTDNVNSMASNLTDQVRNIADVTTAVAKGDLSRKITVEVRGEILRAEEHHQHHGGPAERLRLGSDARGARGGHGRKAGRSGRRQGRRPASGKTSPTTSTPWPAT